ncbi:hypothetical protein JCM6882_001182 [Rhodosporidiobolus microsporus]
MNPSTPPSTPPRQSSPHLASPPRSSSLSHRSPRLGQASFDASLGRGVPPAYTASPRQLFPQASSPLAARNASSETLHIMERPGELSRQPSEEPLKQEPVEWEIGSEEIGVALSTPRNRPPNLNLSRETAALPNLRYSTASAAPSDAPSSSSSTDSSPSSHSDALQPSLKLLFSLTTRRTGLTVILPGFSCALASGLIPPFMTQILGDSLQAFTDYTMTVSQADLTAEALQAANSTLLHAMQDKAIKFAVIATVVSILNSTATSLWVVHGERVARELRIKVYRGLSVKGMDWFDKGMGGSDDTEEGEGGDSAAGLMGRFAKDTDDVRVACSQSMESIIQALSSFVFCLALSLYRNYKLTFVVLASIPIVLIIVAVTERFSGPLAMLERDTTSKCSARVDRIIGAIPTVKAFNAEEEELKGFKTLSKNDLVAYNKLSLVWGIRTGLVQFILMSMFVQGFWFGAYLVREGQATASAVNTCFWACLLAATYLQSCIPLLVTVEKGKIAMAALLTLIRDEPPAPVVAVRSPPAPQSATFSRKRGGRGKRQHGSFEAVEPIVAEKAVDFKADSGPLSPHPFQLSSPTSPHTPVLIPLATTGTLGRRRNGAPRALRKLRPATFSGEISLRNVTFHYPTRPAPAPPALKDVSLYFAARETTYVVGTSGSGKSTVGQLLLGLYKAESGRVEVDEQGLEWIDEEWLRGHVACVSQGASVLFDGTIHDNVAVGVVGQLQDDGTRRRQEDVSRDEVVAACRGALIHDFIRDLPDGYDTWVSGEKGASLSGGQRQRLAIARAWIRDPTVLILDEATSALDATSRLLVNEAVKRWRENRTTIIITHDLAPISHDDFVYVMADGCVVEQGYRGDLERDSAGYFADMSRTQSGPAADKEEAYGEDEAEILDMDDDEDVDPYVVHGTPKSTHSTPRSVVSTPRIRISDADAEASTPSRYSTSLLFPPPATELFRAARELREARRTSAQFGQPPPSRSPSPSPSRPASRQSDLLPLPAFELNDDASSTCSSKAMSRSDSEMSLAALEYAGTAAMQNRSRAAATRIKHRTMNEEDLRKWAARNGTATGPVNPDEAVVEIVEEDRSDRPMLSLKELAKYYWPTIPNRLLFIVGLLLSAVVGACTPVFSTFLSALMANLGTPNNTSIVTLYSLLILLVAAIEGAGSFLKYYLLERCAMGWITSLRRRALGLVVRQDKAFFDEQQNSTSSLSYCIIKDSEDARTVVGTVIGQMVVLVAMLTMGITWAFVTGWELTLVGVGLGPVFIIAMRLQTAVLNRFEAANKVKREAVSKRFHQTMANMRPIRSMSIQPVFAARFERTTEIAYAGGVKAAPFTGFGAALGFTMTYFAEGLMLYVGAVLIVHGRYTFAKMMQVFTLIIFTVTFSGQLMNYLPALTKSLRASNDLKRLLDLKNETKEAEGRMTFPIQGHVSFSDVKFSYPSRPDVAILKGLTFDIKPGECVGIVGASGSGKSTAAALLQRLYEPEAGSVLLDGRPLSRVDVKYLRDHVAVVSQHPALFDMTVADNIAYGSPSTNQNEVENAARSAHIHDFVAGLPKGYQTMLGENASLISGGQAQRLQIARALVQPRELLILDECTSALDPTNQKAVLDTILKVKAGRTTLIVTHKLAIMEQCDRLVVVQDGVVAETGSVAELRARPHGVFAQLASGGEWESS